MCAVVINFIGHNVVNPPGFLAYRPNGQGDYLAILSHSSAYLQYGERVVEFKPNHLLIYRKGTTHHLFTGEREFFLDFIHFDMNEKDLTFFEGLGIPFDVPVGIASSFQLSELIRMIVMEKNLCQAHGDQIIQRMLECFFMKVSDMVHVPPEIDSRHRYYRTLYPIRSELYSQPSRGWTLAEVAKAANMSESYFQHTYRKVFGCSFQADMIASRIRYAQGFLRHSDLTISHIAQLCGYASEAHFMRQFKKVAGITPGQYRRENRKELTEWGQLEQEGQTEADHQGA